jgi:cyclopropane-fatty-acyl-phospholipid synthase
VTIDSSPLSSLARDTGGRRRGPIGALIERLAPAIAHGRLQLVLPNGERVVLGGTAPGAEASLTAHRWSALLRAARNGEQGFADAWLAGDWSTPDLYAVMALFMHNEGALARRADPSALGTLRSRLFHRRNANTRRGSRRNIEAHYDLGNAFYTHWLDAGMSYSSALYAAGDTLEQAQDRKIARICELLDLKEGARVLEIGCGWGALAEQIVRRHGANITGITLSDSQLAYARERLAPETAAGRADLRLQDYRDVADRYDRIVSVEMIEAVGADYWPAYFARLRDAMTACGAAVIQAITIDEARFAAYRARPDFIQRWIFPGGMLPTKAIIAEHAARAGLALVQQEFFGLSYARTLREWRDRFLRAWPAIEPLGFDARFRRMWEYYLAYCEVGFEFRAIDVGLYKLVRRA